MSSPSNGMNRTKTNITVASLINCTNVSRNQLLTSTEKSMKTESILTSNTAKLGSTNVGTIQSNHSLPTVANSDLLYKSVSSPNSNSTPPPLAPTSPVAATLTVNYTLKPYTNIIGTFGGTSIENPLTHIKTLTNVVTSPQTHTKNLSYVDIKPLPNMTTNIFNNILVQPPPIPAADSSLVSLLTTNTPNVFTTPIHSLNEPSISGNKCDSTKTTTMETASVNHKNTSVLKKDLKNKTTVSPLKQNGQMLPAVFVPRGWNRIVEKDYITYIRYDMFLTLIHIQGGSFNMLLPVHYYLS